MWTWKRILIFSLPLLLALVGLAGWFLLRRSIRTRVLMGKQLQADPDIDEWIVTFNWSRKILYLPTILVSLIGFGLMLLKEGGLWTSLNAELIGGIWLLVFFANFLVDEYEMSIKVLLIFVLCAVAMLLWLSLMDWVRPFLRLFRHLGVHIDSTGYLVLALMFALAIAISWIRGLFYYVAITPNYMNVQVGPTETGEQISREDYSTRVDTGDFLERLFGFGRIIITFRDQRRQPLMLLVSRIGKVATRLESIRGKLAVDRHHTTPSGPSAPVENVTE
jgi:hypothetical protein